MIVNLLAEKPVPVDEWITDQPPPHPGWWLTDEPEGYDFWKTDKLYRHWNGAGWSNSYTTPCAVGTGRIRNDRAEHPYSLDYRRWKMEELHE